jgi:hypothetical protein
MGRHPCPKEVHVRKLVSGLVAVAATALLASGLALAAHSAKTYTLSAPLNAKQEVPKQVVKVPRAAGKFTGTLVGSKLRWKLTYHGLSGKASAAHIHLGKAGVSGNVIVPLCAANCRSGMTGKATLKASVAAAIRAGKTYVNVHTAKNQAGEIRGQLKATA